MTDISPSRRRRPRRAENLRSVTYQLRAGVADRVRAAVEAGAAPDADSFVEDAIVAHLKELRRARLYAAYEEAWNDPEYQAEMAELSAEFDGTVGDGLEDA